MVIPLLLKRYTIGVKRYWKNIFEWAFGAWGAVWLLVESLSCLLPQFKSYVDERNTEVIAFFLLVAAIVVVWRLPITMKISFYIPTTNTKVDVLFGNIFQMKGHWVVAVNEFFDGRLGQCVSPNSIHGQLIQKIFNGDTARFEAQADSDLRSITPIVKKRGTGCRENSYPVGTTAAIDVGAHKVFLVALSETDLQTDKARADIPMLWNALLGLWEKVRAYSNGTTVNIPLIGNGQSGVGVEPTHLVRLILLSLLVATRKTEVAKHVRIVLHEGEIDRIDLQTLKSEWR